jgi:hypothetical protein
VKSRLFDFLCRDCGTKRIIRAQVGDNPGTILCSGCRKVEPVSWWRSRPLEPFVQRDLTGVRFGPTDEELAELGVPYCRGRFDLESMQMKEEAPVLNHDAKKQLRLI